MLNNNQLIRFRQIELQLRGTKAFTNEDLHRGLRLTQSQILNLQEIVSDARKERDEVVKQASTSKNFARLTQTLQVINKAEREKVMGVLTRDQKQRYKEMLGAEFKASTFGFGQSGGIAGDTGSRGFKGPGKTTFTAIITQVRSGNVTFYKTQGKATKTGTAMTLPTSSNIKVVKRKYDVQQKKAVGGDPIQGGLKHAMFSNISEKGIRAVITTDLQDQRITEMWIFIK